MANEIKALFGTTAQLTITLASLANVSGRQSTFVDNSTTRWQKIHLYCKVTTGTSPTTIKGIYIYLLEADRTASPNVVTDGGGLTGAAITVVNACQLAGMHADATSNKAYSIDTIVNNPGPSWGVAVYHDTGVALNATAGNHAIWWLGENPEVQ